MTKVVLLRHAAIPEKYQKRYIGHSDISLDVSLFDFSKIKNFSSKYKFDIVYTSDLKRCVETIEYISKDYVSDSRLREMKFKKNIEGKSFEDLEKNEDFKQEYLENINSWYSYICEEPLFDFESRIKEFISTLPKNKEILICAHGGTIRMIHSLFMKKEFDSFLFKVDYLDALEYNLNL